MNTNTLETIDTVETYTNHKGIYAIGCNDINLLLGFISPNNARYFKVKSYNNNINTPLINAHDTDIQYICINKGCSLVASTSISGKVIRIFQIGSGQLILELRRGSE